MTTSRKFVITDTHFGHNNIIKFKDDNGRLTRTKNGVPFSSIEEHDELFVQLWNETVKPDDKVYHLGDVAMPRRALKILDRLVGRKILVAGNHDIWDLSDLTPYFEDIKGCVIHQIDRNTRYILTHVPVHDGTKIRFSGNIHGHLHQNVIKNHYGRPDHWFWNAAPELRGYKPILLDDIISEYNFYRHEVAESRKIAEKRYMGAC